MRGILRASLASLLLFSVLFGVVYPAVVTAFIQIVFPEKARGSLIVAEGKVLGSTLIGRHFSAPRYFWARPSATSPFPYNAAASAGSNFSPANPELLRFAKARIAELQKADPGNRRPIPVDLVAASGSGLDPHISLAAAEYQLARVARARKMSEAKVRALVEKYTEQRQFGLLGEPRVNVLRLNLALDAK